MPPKAKPRGSLQHSASLPRIPNGDATPVQMRKQPSEAALASSHRRARGTGSKRSASSKRSSAAPSEAAFDAAPESEGSPLLRPDERLLDAVRLESGFGSQASVEAVYQLLRQGEDANARSLQGLTPLAIAAAKGCAPLVALLLEYKAAVDTAVGDVSRAEVPLHLAARGGHRSVCQLLCAPTRERNLLDAVNSIGCTPVHLAVSGGHNEALTVLLREGASVNARNEPRMNSTAVHLAAHAGNPETIETLSTFHADLDLVDTLGRTALHIVVAKGILPCVSMLLWNSADPSVRDREGRAPIDLVTSEHAKGANMHALLSGAAYKPEVLPASLTRFDIRIKADVL